MIMNTFCWYNHSYTHREMERETCGNSSLRKGKVPAGYETWFQPEDVFLGMRSGCFSLSECLQAVEAGFNVQCCPRNGSTLSGN